MRDANSVVDSEAFFVARAVDVRGCCSSVSDSGIRSNDGRASMIELVRDVVRNLEFAVGPLASCQAHQPCAVVLLLFKLRCGHLFTPASLALATLTSSLRLDCRAIEAEFGNL